MSPEWIGVSGFAVLLLLIFLRVPVGIAMLAVGLAGSAILNSPESAVMLMTGQTFSVSTLYSLSVLPLFILMGNIASQAGLSRDLYDAAYALVGHLKGGLASATIVGCAGFAALSGSSIASAVTMGQVAYPEMQRRRYGNRLSTGAIAAGGTLGILLPPSTGFVLYAIMTEQSIGRLFMAGLLPGILLTSLFVLTVMLVVHFSPDSGGMAPEKSHQSRATTFLKAFPVFGIIVITIGGIYLGLFTPVEAAGVGAALAIMMASVRRRLSVSGFIAAVKGTLETTGLCFLILIGAMVFSPFVALSELPTALSTLVLGFSSSPYVVLLMILVLYLFLGMIIEGLSLMVITLPIVFPVITGLGFDPIWFGVIMVLVLEMGLISPPVGVNCFVVHSVAPDVPLSDIFKGILPFWAAMIVCIMLLVAMPQIALFLPEAMF